MAATGFFSPRYDIARERFIEALAPAGFIHEARAIAAKGPAGETLSIDVGIRPGKPGGRALVITSGLHGVEGYFGSAVQLAALSDADWLKEAGDQTIVLVHALNPYGFAWNRRWNEDNIDLNRSFFSADESRPAANPDFAGLARFLGAHRAPSRPDTFPLEALWHLGRHGLSKLKQTIPVGQYEHPVCLFYGGNAPTETQLILEAGLADWVGEAASLQLVDLHTGLGKWGTYKLLVSRDTEDGEYADLLRRFGPEALEDLAKRRGEGGVSYEVQGDFLRWFRRHFADRDCHATLAEFGTYSNARVLQALRAENRAHHAGEPDGRHAWAKTELVEVFAPASEEWRDKVVAQGRDICRRALGA